jgi:hypothetical protein
MGGLNLQGCESLEELDCAENSGIKKVDCSNLKKLKTLSCKVTSKLTEINVSNCENLTFLDYSLPSNISVLNLDGANNLKEVYYSKEAKVFPDWRTIPSLEKVGILERKQVEGEDGLEWCAFMEEIDCLGIKNTEWIQEILANPNDYSLEDLLKLDRKSLYGVSTDLREKLAELAKQKHEEIRLQKEKEFADELRKRFGEKHHFLGDEQEKLTKKETPPLEKDNDSSSEEPSESPTPQDTPTPQQSPSAPKENDDKKTILALQQKITELESKIRKLEFGNKRQETEIRNEILNSSFSEEQKQELLKMLESKQASIVFENQ